MTIEIRTHPKFSARVQRTRMKRIAEKVLRVERTRAALTIYITTDAEMRKLNRQFHATDAPTDVLAFPMDDGGDIAISYDTAKRQARDAGWRIADELDLLVTHGILHLLGYDDGTPRKRARMWQRQRAILGHINEISKR
jgi:probable rRNA maturation factor